MAVSANNSIVASMSFGPGLLEKYDPQFATLRLRKGNLPIFVARYIIINYNLKPLAILYQFNCINALGSYLIGYKHFLYSAPFLTNYYKRA